MGDGRGARRGFKCVLLLEEAEGRVNRGGLGIKGEAYRGGESKGRSESTG
jgi:hypothetical protein